MAVEDIQIMRLDITDIDGNEYGDVSVDFANQHLLNRVKVLTVFFGERTFNWSYDAVKAFERKAPIFFDELSKFLFQTTRRIDAIKIIDMPDLVGMVPEYLRFVSSSVRITDWIDGTDSFFHTGPLACFMAGLCHVDGPKKLSMTFGYSSSGHACEMLSMGIAASPSLEILEINEIDFDLEPEGCDFLINGLRKNESLKSFSISLCDEEGFDHHTGILEAGLLHHSKLQTFKMKFGDNIMDDAVHRHGWNILRNGVSRPNCLLKEIWLDNFSLPDKIDDTTTMTINTTVKSLALVNTNQSLSTVMKAVRMFKSLEHLDISGGDFSDGDLLSALDELLLLPETACLESLCMSQCQIGTEAMMTFVRKLDRMKELKVLIAADNPFTHSETCMKALKEALWKNTSLEFVSVGGSLPKSIAEQLNLPPILLNESSSATSSSTPEQLRLRLLRLSSLEMLPLHLNRAGRGDLLVHSENLMQANLLPQILERAGKLDYYTCGKEDAKDDVTFWLLRHLMISELTV